MKHARLSRPQMDSHFHFKMSHHTKSPSFDNHLEKLGEYGCPLLVKREANRAKKDMQKTLNGLAKKKVEANILLSEIRAEEVTPSKKEQLEKLETRTIAIIEDCSTTTDKCLKDIELYGRVAEMADILSLVCMWGLGSKALTFEQLSAHVGVASAKRIRRKALLTGYLWCPNQAFATQGVAEFLFMLVLPGRVENLEALCEVNLTRYKGRLEKRGATLAILAYWKDMVVDAISVCKIQCKWQLGIGMAISTLAAAWHWLGLIVHTIKSICQGIGIAF